MAIKRLTTEIFIERAKAKHSIDRYDYSESEYKGPYIKVKIRCNKCGHIFEQLPYNHLAGRGCPECRRIKITYTTEIFIEKALKVHSLLYDYSMVNYKNSKTKVKIKCNKCGYIFEQQPDVHLMGQGCPVCAGTMKLTREEVIKRFRAVHGNKYDYSKINYINTQENIEIFCLRHNKTFWQKVHKHILGQGCPDCFKEDQFMGKEEFIRRAREIHGDKYDYSSVIYQHSAVKIKIRCRECDHIFEQIPHSHLQGHGCPKCSILLKKSKGEIELTEYIKSIYFEEIMENTRDFLGGKELDIYLPDIQLAIEYNGNYWHALYEENDPGYHENKRKTCKEVNIKLIEIWENDWKKNKDQIKESLKKQIGELIKISTKIKSG